MSATVPLSALECSVCLSLLCQPVSLSCGHTFCRVCLINTLRRNKKKCPTCRAVCHNSAEDQPEDVMIANIIRMCFPELAEKRRRETEAERNALTAILPIFYYNMPMFPGEVLNLHFFEPRYKLMMQRIVNTSRRFAYVPNYTNYSADIGDVAVVAEVSECEFLSDGRVLLSAKLTSRETVTEHFIEEGTQGLHYCRLAPRVDKAPSVESGATAEIAELHETTRALVSRIIAPTRSQFVDRFGDMPRNAAGLSLWIAAVLPISAQKKHDLLAGTCTLSRLRVCERYLVTLGGGSGSGSGSSPPPARPQRAVAEAYVRHFAVGEAVEDVSVAPYAAEEGEEESGTIEMSHVDDAAARGVSARAAGDILEEDMPNEVTVESGVASDNFQGERFVGAAGGGGNTGEHHTSVDGYR